jgi:alkylation response protein AidB-like acyl-CoA dehydrogenase
VDFSLTEEQIELKKWAHEFAEKEIRPVAADYDESEEFPWPVLEKAAQAGLYSLDIYLQHQQDDTGLTLPLVMEEVFWGCAGIGLCLFGTGLPLAALASGGTPEQLADAGWPELRHDRKKFQFFLERAARAWVEARIEAEEMTPWRGFHGRISQALDHLCHSIEELEATLSAHLLSTRHAT